VGLTVTVVAAAPGQDVWARLADIPRWPDWNPACLEAEIEGPLAPGSQIGLRLLHPRGTQFWTRPVLTDVEPERLLAWTTKAVGLRAPTAIRLAPAEDGTLVTLDAEARGALSFNYRLAVPEATLAQIWSGALTGLARSFRDPEGS